MLEVELSELKREFTNICSLYGLGAVGSELGNYRPV